MCIPDSRYGLTLARVTSENSTVLLESNILRLFSLDPIPCCLVSLVLTAPPWIHANLSVRLSPVQPQLPSAACLSAPQPPTLNYCLPLCSPATNSSVVSCPTTNSLLGRVVNSHSPPRTTSGYGEISCPRILCLVSRQNRQLNRLLWQPTPIVLQ